VRLSSGDGAPAPQGALQQLGFAAVRGELLDAPWPQVDGQALKQDEIELMLQINGMFAEESSSTQNGIEPLFPDK
jgi:leucyl-tRNA synthetase